MSSQRAAKEAFYHSAVDSPYGWVIVALGMLSIAVQTAIYFSSSLFLVAISDDTGWSRTSVSFGISAYVVGCGIWSVLVGLVVRARGPRQTISLAACITAAGLLLLSGVQNLSLFSAALFFPVALGNTGMGALPNYATIQSWFQRRRGLALGLADAGASLGIAFLVPLVHLTILTLGWRGAYVGMAGMALMLVPLHLVLQRQIPSEETNCGPAAAEPLASSFGFTRLISSGTFWLTFVGLGAGWFSTQMIMVHQVAYLVDQRFDAVSIDVGLATIGLAGLVGRLGLGWLSDRIGVTRVYGLATASMVIGIACLIIAGQSGLMPFLFLFGVFFGCSLGNATMMFARKVHDLFGSQNFAATMGVAYVGAYIGGAVGSASAGVLFDASGSYFGPFGASIAVALLSFGCMSTLPPKPQLRSSLGRLLFPRPR